MIQIQDIHSQLESLLSTLSDEIENTAVSDSSISGWSVGQQIYHVLIVLSGMAVALRREQDATGGRSSNNYLDAILETGSIPRGHFVAPAAVQPSEQPSTTDLNRLLLKTRKRISGLLGLDPKSTVIHPILGPIDRDESLRFMVIHTNHHQAIIKDILVSASERDANVNIPG